MAMYRKRRVMISSAVAALAGSVILLTSTMWISWRQSLAAEEVYTGGLATALGTSAEQIILDTREMLANLNGLAAARCSPEHLRAMQDVGVSRPFVRAIGYWQANERVCGIGFFMHGGLRPAHADRIYDSGVVAWWPSEQTEVGGTRMFLMRYGDHDAAIDPRMLLELGPAHERKAVLWVEGMRMSAVPVDVALPAPGSLPIGVSVDHRHGLVFSHFSQNAILPIDVVASEPLNQVVIRHAQTLLTGAALGLLMVGLWCYLVVRFSSYELSMATQLRKALAAGQIYVQYQPVMDMVSGRCVGAEALARWKVDGEPISPSIFIPVAEQAGVIQEVTAAVLRRAVLDMRELLLEHPELSINLNLSADDLKNDRIGTELRSCLTEANLPPKAIKLEITERALVNTETSRSLIRELRNRGHQIAIDDFGTGYSSLSYLQSFELDVLKIDKAFVDAIGTEAATSQVIIHVIEMARSLGLETVAEGVMTPMHAIWLIEHGVGLGQGFLFSKPLSPEDFHEYFAAQRTRTLAAA
jgi:sensor c-di-GMP phosphodiesterase-like protein